MDLLPFSRRVRHSSFSFPERLFLICLIVVLAARLAVLLTPGSLSTDPDSYQLVATGLVTRGSFSLQGRPTAYRPPLYPLLLAGVQMCWGTSWRAGVAVVHLMMGWATALCAGIVAGRLGGLRAAAFAVVLVGLDPLLLHSSRLVMTETQSAFLAAIVLWLAATPHLLGHSGRPLLLGAVLGACTLTRPPFLLWPIAAGCVAVWFALRDIKARNQLEKPCKQGGLRARGLTIISHLERWFVGSSPDVTDRPHLSGLLILIGMFLTLLPWIVRNSLVFGRPIVGTTHGGYTFYLANNEEFYAFLRKGDGHPVWNAAEFNRKWENLVASEAGFDELKADAMAYRFAWETIRSQPGIFVYSCAYRLIQLWRPMPHQIDPLERPVTRLIRWAIGFFYLVEYVLALWGLGLLLRKLARREESPTRAIVIWGLGLVLSLSLVHTFYWSNLRMRAPLIPVLAIWASVGAELFWRAPWPRGGSRIGPGN